LIGLNGLSAKRAIRLAVSLALVLLGAGLLLAACGSDPQPAHSTTQPAPTASPAGSAGSGVEVTFVELGSDNCIPCKEMRPIMDSIARKYKGVVEVVFYDVYENRDAVDRFGIRVIPTQVFLDGSGQEFYRHEGFLAQLLIESLLSNRGIQPTGDAE